MACDKHINDNFYMQRCLQLAANGLGRTSPNPMVGAVIVRQGRIIGEGWHRQAGQPHAEPNAIRSVEREEWLKDSTLYVNLEPCSHYGKTPPCADLIIEKGIPRVVIGCSDPFPEVSGRGIAKLRAAGIQVTTDVEKEACWMLNRCFFRSCLSQRPYIILKWAQTADGFTDVERSATLSEKNTKERLASFETQKALKISDEFGLLMVHQLRSQVDAIMVGTQTALLDNPSLTVRHWASHKQPLRVVLDRKAVLSPSSALFNSEASTLIFTEAETVSASTSANGIEYVPLYRLDEVMNELHRRGVQSLLVEGGSTLQNAFIAANLWDEIRIETSPMTIGHGHPAPLLPQEALESNLFYEYRTVDSGHVIRSSFREFLR